MFNHLELIATTLRFSISVSFSPQPSSASNPSHKVQKQRQPEGERATPFPPGTIREEQGRVAVSGGFRAVRCAQIIIPSTTAFSQAGGGSGSSAGSTSCSTSCLRRQPRTLHSSSLLQFHQHQLLPHARSGPAFVQRLVQKVVRSTSTNSSLLGLFEVLG